jgi:hypothetical protein
MKKNKKGSTLLLAMVVISTVLFAGIGVATILSRQIKEIPTVENEAVGFYLAETVADKMSRENLEDFDCNDLDFVDWCDAEKINEDYHIKIKVGGNYYKFVKKDSEIGSGDDEEDIVPEGFVRIYYHSGPWGSWSEWGDPLINVRYYPSGTIIGGGNMTMSEAFSKFSNGWYVRDIEIEKEEGLRVFFQDSLSSTRDYGSDGGWYHLIPKEKNIAHIRQEVSTNTDLADFGNPITVYYKPNESWGTPLVSFRWDTDPIRIATKLTPMNDASGKAGEGWYVFHHSGDKRSHLLLFFSKDETNNNRDYGNYRTYYYCVEKERTVYIDENTNKDDFLCN